MPAPSFKPVTKRRFIFEQLREEIRAGRYSPGARVETTDELARKFGVSALTVHGALRDLVHEGHLVRHQGKGTFVAERPEGEKRSLSSNLAIVIPYREDTIAIGANDYVMAMIQGATEGAQESGANLSMFIVPSYFPGEKEMMKAADRLMVYDGMLFIADQYAPLIAELNRRGKPVCTIDGEQKNCAVWTRFDREAAITSGIEHLVAVGRKRIGYFGAIQSHGSMKEEVYRRVLTRAGLEVDPVLIRRSDIPPRSYRLAREYLEEAQPDAVFIDNYLNAEIVASVAMDLGLRVPEDIAVVGYGLGRSDPGQLALSYVGVPYYEIGARGAALLDQVVRGEVQPPVVKTVPTVLNVRASCNAAKSEVAL